MSGAQGASQDTVFVIMDWSSGRLREIVAVCATESRTLEHFNDPVMTPGDGRRFCYEPDGGDLRIAQSRSVE